MDLDDLEKKAVASKAKVLLLSHMRSKASFYSTLLPYRQWKNTKNTLPNLVTLYLGQTVRHKVHGSSIIVGRQ